METNDYNLSNPRREFLGKLAAGATVLSLASLFAPFTAEGHANLPAAEEDLEGWFNKIKGKSRMVFDATEPHGVFPFAWPRVFLMTNEKTGTPASECSTLVVLRHAAIPFAMETRLWEKYNFGEVFHVTDEETKKTVNRNAFWQPKEGDFKVPGIGNVQIGINELQASGVMFCVCNMAMTVYSAVLAQKMGLDAVAVKKDFDSGVLPGIQVVPSGVWALGKAHEKGCAYVFVR